jgi:hypothetical protein
MRADDVVNALATRLPFFTDAFSDSVDIESISSTGTTATATTTSAHGFIAGQQVVITGAKTPINVSSFTRLGTLGTIITESDHDATKGLNAVPENVEVDGALQSEFNGSFPLASVPNRRTLNVIMENTGGVAASGDIKALNVASALSQYNGLQEILTVPTDTTFTYSIDSELSTADNSDIAANGNIRVSASATIERAVDAYTEQQINDAWAFVVLGNAVASKNRAILSDATDDQQRQQQGDNFRQQIIQPVSVYVFLPASEEIAGRNARDTAQDLWRPICQSILFERFDTGLYVGEYNALQFTSHSFFQYNSAFYVHEFAFEQVEPLQFEDSSGYSVDVAFRDIDLTIGVTTGNGELLAEIDLDDIPIT